MSEIKLNHVVIHELIKAQHKPIEGPNIRDGVLDPNLETVIKLVEGITSLYGKRNNAAHYGTFRNDEGCGPFPNAFQSYAGLEVPDDKIFLSLSSTAIWALYRKAESIHSSSGGYILFADYSNSQGRYFLVAMIKQKDGLTLSRELVPEELTQLDLSRLYQAAKISFGKLSAFKAASPSDRQELNYLSFVSPSSSKTAAGYFVTALGCAPGTASARATDTIVRASTAFFRDHAELRHHRQSFKNDLIDYLTKKEENKQSVKLSEVEQLARKYIPADQDEKADEIADMFISHLNDEKNAVPVEFPVNKTALSRHRQIRYKSDNWDLSFERSALGETENAQVYYDRKHNRLVLNALPERMVELIHEELDCRDDNKTIDIQVEKLISEQKSLNAIQMDSEKIRSSS